MTSALQTSIETWKPWRDGRYWASDKGNIKRVHHNRQRVLKHTIAPSGRHTVAIIDPGGLQSTVSVAFIVLETFDQRWHLGLHLQPHHVDGNRHNLSLDNLRWVPR